MNNKKLKTKLNNENLCPYKRKRIPTNTSAKSTPHSGWKLAKFESVSSPSSTLSVDLLEEMGIGMLDSEESSSSAASAIALAVSVSGSGDENSNEATPNCDAPKMSHSRLGYCCENLSLDVSTDNGSNHSFTDANAIINKIGSPIINSNNNHGTINNINNNNKINNNTDVIHDSTEKNTALPLHRKVAILGAGAGKLTTTTMTMTSNINIQINNNVNANVNINASPGKNTRSPLATVICNNFVHQSNKNCQQQQQQQSQLQSQIPKTYSPVIGHVGTTPHAIVGGTTAQNANRLESPVLPSTSRQAAAIAQMKQRQILQQNQHQQQQHVRQQQQQVHQQQQHVRFIPDENFFLFRINPHNEYTTSGKDYFTLISDEIILQIFKWLPKRALLRCAVVCRRFNRCARDESLWPRLDMGGRHIRAGAMEHILTRGVMIFRLAQAQIDHPVFESEFLQYEPKFESKLQYLDLSMVTITKPSLKMLLSCCGQLKKLSLEHVPLNDEICKEIAKNTQLEALNLAMCTGLEAWSVRKLMEALNSLTSLNISWTNLSVDAVTSLVTNVTPNLLRLNVAGCRKTMFDSHICSLVNRCPQLLELDLSDCTALTGNAVGFICKFKMLEYLSLSRCYLIQATYYMDLTQLPTLTYLDVFGMLSDSARQMLEEYFPNLGINKFIQSSVARPTVGTRRTSIWGLRTRD